MQRRSIASSCRRFARGGPRRYADAGATFRVARQSVLVQVRNLFDRRVYTDGYPGAAVGSSDPDAMEAYYYTLAPRNLSVNVRIAF